MSCPPPQPDARPLSLRSGFFRVNGTTFLLEPLEGAVAGRHAVYRAAHLRGKRGTCREPGATLEYDREPKIPAAMKLYRWVGTARPLLPEPGPRAVPAGAGPFRASWPCPAPPSCWLGWLLLGIGPRIPCHWQQHPPRPRALWCLQSWVCYPGGRLGFSSMRAGRGNPAKQHHRAELGDLLTLADPPGSNTSHGRVSCLAWRAAS